ncbi:MAG: hypothetical protein HY319_21820 [Armatimonadetes bacterium]|nr:hypothetical protein [Armatimonadota bacterium]
MSRRWRSRIARASNHAAPFEDELPEPPPVREVAPPAHPPEEPMENTVSSAAPSVERSVRISAPPGVQASGLPCQSAGSGAGTWLSIPDTIPLWEQELKLLREFEDALESPSLSDTLAIYLAEFLHRRAGELLRAVHDRRELFPTQLVLELVEIHDDVAEFLRDPQAASWEAETVRPRVTLENTYNTVPNIPGLPGAPARVENRRPGVIPGINDMSAFPENREHLASLENSLLG